MPADRDSITPEAQPRFGWLRLIFDAALLWSFLSAISIPLRLDNWPPAVFLSYPPRAPYILFGVGYASYLLLTLLSRHQAKHAARIRICICLITVISCIYSLGWNPLRATPHAPSKNSFSLVTANTGGHPVEFVNRTSQVKHPHIICLQEVSLSHRKAIETAFPNHQWFYGTDDKDHDRNDNLVFTNTTGLLRSTFETERATVVADITGYRTFAVQTPLRSEPSKSIAIVNVHTAKALAFHAGLQGFISETPSKSHQHVDERTGIEAWANKQPANTAILMAGDFNAPTKTVGVRFSQFTNSHLIASTNSLLTFPADWPMLGIDHVLGNNQVDFTKSEVFQNESSDHHYRRVEFGVLQR